MKILSDPSTFILGAITIIIIIFEIIHFFGFLELERIHKKINNIILVLLSIFIILMISQNYKLNQDVDKIVSSINKMENNQNNSVEYLLSKLEKQLPDTLKEIGKEQFELARKIYLDGINRKKVMVYTLEEDATFLWRCMEKFPEEYFGVSKAQTEALSSESEKTELEIRTENFIKNGGEVTRVLYLMGEDVVPKSVSDKIIEKQLAMNVKVYTIDVNKIRPEFKNKYFALSGDFVSVTSHGINETYESTLSNNPELVNEYRQFKEWLISHANLVESK